MSEEKILSEEGMINNGSISISGMYKEWFLDYASYVILERAVPALEDGFKPVQRRIFHAMKEMDDGRFNKVANVIGQTMQYHPHGDASIGDAMVNLGQKDLLIETQGNWGDIRTGDSAAAPRYIEARLSKLAKEILFNPKVTDWQLSYDGRKKEPIHLPVKFPMVLAQGVEGIAVGLSTKILPHNFVELIDASIAHLKGEAFELYPDFPTSGLADFSQYQQGKKGSRVKVRAKIEKYDKSTLAITEIPFSTTTESLIDSILKANDQSKIKIKKVVDNTAKDVEILINLPKNTSADVTIDALYAFTDCEVSISPNACVILDDKPHFFGVDEILKRSTQRTKGLLKKELEIFLGELNDKWHASSLEKIFIENRIYRDIEECETWEAVIQSIDKGLTPFKPLLKKEITEEDIVKLTEIKIKRISKYDTFKADEHIRQLEADIDQTNFDLENLNDFTIRYFESLKKKFREGKERKTTITSFETIDASVVAVANEKLYVNRKTGFIGTGLKKEEFVMDCSDMDDIIVFMKNGEYKVVKVSDKLFVGKDIIHAAVWNKGDERMAYNVIYVDGKTGISRAKRFNITSVIRDKMYNLTKGTPYSKVLYFSANANSESEKVMVLLSNACKALKKKFEFDFTDIDIKNKTAQGNIVTKYPMKRVSFLEKGPSSLGGIDIWYDPQVGRLNRDERGTYLGNFDADDAILVITKDGNYRLTSYELTNHYEQEKIELIAKFEPEKVFTAVHYVSKNKAYFVKRFQIETTTKDKDFCFIQEGKNNQLVYISDHPAPEVKLYTKNGKTENTPEAIELNNFIDVKGWKAMGNKLADKDSFQKLEDNSMDLAEWKKQQEAEKEAAKKAESSAASLPFDHNETAEN